MPKHWQATFVPDGAVPAGGHVVLWGGDEPGHGFPPGEQVLLTEPTRVFRTAERVTYRSTPLLGGLDRRAGNGIPDHRADALTAGGVDVRIGLSVYSIKPRLRAVDDATFRWEAVAGEQCLTALELEQMTASGQPLVRWNDSWVRAARRRGARQEVALSGAETRRSPVSRRWPRRSPANRTPVSSVGDEVITEGRVATLAEGLRHAGKGREPSLCDVDALRDYQGRGVASLQSLAGMGFGTLLADDMGLGKTLQAICLLASGTESGPHPVVCPTSVVGNWERELSRFAPHTTVVRHHGPNRKSVLAEPGVVVTSCNVLRRDCDMLTDVLWDVVVLDGAQQIKNQSAQASLAASDLKSAARVALTGTPVENRSPSCGRS